MRYLHTMVRVTNIDESLHFYCEILGLSELYRHDSEEGRFTNIFLVAPEDVDTANTARSPILELTYNWPSEDGSPSEQYTAGRNFGHLAYAVTDIYATCQAIQQAGVTINRPPRDGRMAFIKSPDGISIELLQEGDPLPIQEPWSSMENVGSW